MLQKNMETTYKQLIKNMGEAAWLGNINGKTTFANTAFYKLLDIKKETLNKKNIFDFLELKNKGVKSCHEAVLLRKNKQKIPIYLHNIKLDDDWCIKIATDLRKIKKQESVYKKLIENMHEGVWMGDEKNRTIYANPRFCSMLDYSFEEMAGKDFFSFWDKKSIEKIKKLNKTKHKKGLSTACEGILLSKKREMPVFLSATPLCSGGFIGIITDLSELKKKEKSEKMLSKAIKYSTDAIIVFNDKRKVLIWNKGAKTMLGYKESEIINKDIKTIIPLQKLRLMLKNCEGLQNLEIEVKHKNGNKIKIATTFTPIFNKKNENHDNEDNYLIIARDITTQRSLEEELDIKHQKIKEVYGDLGNIKRQTDYMFELIDLCNENHDKKTIADFIVSSIAMLTKIDACVFRIHEPGKGTLELLSSFGVGADWAGKSTIKLKNSLLERAYKKNFPLKIIDIGKELQYQSKHLAKKNNLYSLLLVPIQFQGQLIGSLSLYASPEKKISIFENDFIEKYSKLINMIVYHMVYLS